MDLPKAVDLKSKTMNAIQVLSELHNYLQTRLADVAELNMNLAGHAEEVEKVKKELEFVRKQVEDSKALKEKIEKEIEEWKAAQIQEINASAARAKRDMEDANSMLATIRVKEAALNAEKDAFDVTTPGA